jgi:purine-binding chemotaxis protein CheW
MSHITHSNDASDDLQILRARARALARKPEVHDGKEALLDLVEFQLGAERYAVESRHVTEVLALGMLTPLPCTPPFVAGIINVRGRIIMVMDLKKFFNVPDTGLTDLHRVIHIQAEGMELGLLADASTGMRRIAIDRLHAPPATLSGIRADYLRGVTGDLLIVLDLVRILADPGIIVHEEVGSPARKIKERSLS